MASAITYSTPNDFIQDYLETQLRFFEQEAVKETTWVEQGVMRASTLDKSWDHIDKLKVELNDFLDGKASIRLGLQLTARLATRPYANIKPSWSMGLLEEESELSDLLSWADIVCDEYDLSLQLNLNPLSVIISCNNPRSGRNRVKRHGWYDEIDWPNNAEFNPALVLALIAAYDHGLWGKQ